MLNDWLNILMAVLQALISIGTLFVAWRTVILTREVSQESKKADVTMECNRRFDELWSLWMQYNPPAPNDPFLYYRRFWSLQKDEYDYYVKGYIDDDVFRYWMNSRHEEWVANSKIGNTTYQEGWDMVHKCWKKGLFDEFIVDVFYGNIDKAMLRVKKKAG